MKYGVSVISIIPCRSEPADQAEQTTQLLFGEHYKVLEERKKFVRIRNAFDGYESWICRRQHTEIYEEEYSHLNDLHMCCSTLDLLGILTCKDDDSIITLPLGATLPGIKDGTFQLAGKVYEYSGDIISKPGKDKVKLIEHALMYENAPYLWGGRSPFGIDCSGYTQMIYKLNGIKLPRDASQQAKIGTTLSFVEEAEPGDLAFFDNAEGNITHVGILLENNHIIHASGKVRIDRIDHQGIYDESTRSYSHSLRIIKRIYPHK